MSHIHEGERQRLIKQTQEVLTTLQNVLEHIQDNTILAEMLDTLGNIKIAHQSFREDLGLTYFYLAEGEPSQLFIAPWPIAGLSVWAALPGYDVKELEQRFRHLILPNGWYEVNEEVQQFFAEMIARLPPEGFGDDLNDVLGASGISLSDN